MDNWKLRQTKQCSKCPWLTNTDPYTIPDGYDVEKHQALAGTIAEPGVIPTDTNLRVMACHETDSDYCIGWLNHQLGEGNNIGLRVRFMNCTNAGDIELIGEQHPNFESTLPRVR